MKLLWNLNDQSKAKLNTHGFIQSMGSNEGLYQYYEWANDLFKIGLYYEKGYYECHLISVKKETKTQPLIPLLRFIKNNPEYYAQELKEANLWNTLETNVYLGLVFEHYSEILSFFESVNEKVLHEKKLFDKAIYGKKN